MLVTSLDAKQLTKGLKLTNHQITRSNLDRVKHTWDIPLMMTDAGMEIIGDNQADADVMAWHCWEHDAAGDRIPAAGASSLCRRLFERVLSNVVTQPVAVADYLLARAVRFAPKDGYLVRGGVSIEVSASGFYFVRKLRHGLNL